MENNQKKRSGLPLIHVLEAIKGRLPGKSEAETKKLLDNIVAKQSVTVNGISSTEGITALHWAIQNHFNNLVSALLKMKAWSNKLNDFGDHPINIAINHDNIEALEMLIDNKAYINHEDDSDQRTPLMNVLIDGNVLFADLLLRKKADVFRQDFEGYTALMMASENRDMPTNISRQILDRSRNGFDDEEREDRKREYLEYKDLRGQTSLIKAVISDNAAAVRLLVESGADVAPRDKKLRTPAFWSVIRNNRLMLKYLIANRANINARTSDGVTLLGHAVKNNMGEIVVDLIKAGANLELTDRGATPLVHAAKSGNTKIALALLKSGSEPNASSEVHDGHTALIFAIKRGDKVLAGSLIQHGVDVNTENKHGWTPLMYATTLFEEKPEVGYKLIEMLMSAGADPGIKSDAGVTAINLATKIGNDDLVHAYRRATAQVRFKNEYGEDGEKVLRNAMFGNTASGYQFYNSLGESEMDEFFVSGKAEFDREKKHESEAKRLEEGKRAFIDLIFDGAENVLSSGLPIFAASQGQYEIAASLSAITIGKWFLGKNRETAEKVIDFIDHVCIKVHLSVSDVTGRMSDEARSASKAFIRGLQSIRNIALSVFGSRAEVEETARKEDRELHAEGVSKAVTSASYDDLLTMGVEDIGELLSDDYKILFKENHSDPGSSKSPKGLDEVDEYLAEVRPIRRSAGSGLGMS